MQKLLFKIAIIGMLFLPFSAFAVDYPSYTGHVNDYADILTETQKAHLENRLRAYEKEAGIEIAILLINTTNGVPINDYAIGLGNEWGVGKSEQDNGIVMVGAMLDRDFFIATGRQTEVFISDGEAGSIVRNYLVPYFKEEQYFKGISVTLEQVILGLEGKEFAVLDDESSEFDIGMVFSLGIMLVSALVWLGAVLGRSKRIWPGAVIGLIGGFLLFTILNSGFEATLIGSSVFAILGLVFDALVSSEYKNAKSSGRSPSWWAGGGGWSSGSSSGGGFGGFGGGSFGGGGGGGSW